MTPPGDASPRHGPAEGTRREEDSMSAPSYHCTALRSQ